MIVFSRKKNEAIVVNNDIIISVVEILRGKVRLMIEAPREVPIHRHEVFVAIHGRLPRAEDAGFMQMFSYLPPPPADPPRRTRGRRISVDQLVSELGATDAEVNRRRRFTSEGGIRPAARRRR